MEDITGYVDHFIFQTEDGYKIMSFSMAEEDIVVVGTLPSVTEGENLILHGEWVEHPTYGKQFKANSFEVTEPTDIAGIEHYLASGAVKGVGKATAKRIVARFKEDTLRIMEEEPAKLAEIKGISLKKAIGIADQISEKKELRDVMIFLDGYGIGSVLALRIYGEYGAEVYSIVKSNPYKLAEDIDGLGFKRADAIALKMNIALDSDYRIRSAIIYVLGLAVNQGHTFVNTDRLRDNVSHLIGVEITDFTNHLSNLAVDKKIIVKDDNVYLATNYYMEAKAARLLVDLDNTFTIEERAFDEAIDNIEQRQHIKLDDLQRDAVKTAVTRGVCVLTGGPGTGKTTTIKTMIEFFELEGLDIALAAPTGRAAKRMTEATGRGAKTIHRLLEVKGAAGDDNVVATFDRNEDNPIECDVLILDEMSMVDINIFYFLMKAIGPSTRLIMVGDTNQLPSVGAGNVLKDIIATDVFAVVTLDKVFRQTGGSDIVVNAYKINKGEHPVIDNKSEDFFFMKRSDAHQITEVVTKLVKEQLPKYVDATSNDIQVLCPSKKGLLGTPALNQIMQERLNPPSNTKEEYNYGDKIFRVGDKVMQIKNNYQAEWKVIGDYNIATESGTGVFNGDMGNVISIDKFSSTLTVEFDEGRQVVYPFSGLNELEHAYAVTIHKSQGSEYPAVVIPLLQTPEQLMTRNIIYTAITRAKKCVVIVGSEDVFYRMIDNAEIAKRNSSLGERILELASI